MPDSPAAKLDAPASPSGTPHVFAELSPPYSTIVADPPWHYDGFISIPGGNRPNGPARVKDMDYASMSPDQIAGLPIADLSNRHSALFLWATNAYLPDALWIMKAWGFRYRQTLVWHKTGNPSPFGGSLAPNHAEFLLYATQGKPSLTGRLPSSVVDAPKLRQHSRKPAVFGDLVEQVSPGPYVELFARSPRLGWDHWGHGYEIGVDAVVAP